MLNGTEAHDRLVASYVRLVKAGKLTIDQVPESLREEVRAKLDEE